MKFFNCKLWKSSKNVLNIIKYSGGDTHTENIILNKLNKPHFYAEI